MKKFLISLLIFSFTLYGLFLTYEFFARYPKSQIHTEVLSQAPRIKYQFEEWKQFSNFSPESEVRYFAGNPLFPVFDVNYRFDQNALRVETLKNPKATEHIIFGGCSMVFGVAINEQDTLSSVTRQKNPHINAVNFGFPGGGLQNMIRALDFYDLHEYAKEDSGTFVYMFQSDHVDRWLATPKYLQWAHKNSVHYHMEGKKLIPMKLSESDVFKKYQSVKKAGLEKSYLAMSGIRKFQENDLDSFVFGLKELRSRYLRMFPKGKFLVVVYSNPETVGVLKSVLLKEHIEVFDLNTEYNELLSQKNFNPAQFQVPVDGHPNRKFNEFVSEKILLKMAGQKAK